MDTKLEGKVLLTGASGFIGSRLRDRLLEGGVDVVAIRRADSPAPRRGRSVVADYADRDALEKLIVDERPDYVLHVAGATKGIAYEDFRKANVMPTENLVRAVRSKHPGLERFVFVSSQAAYGPAVDRKPVVESDPKKPVEFYGRSKMEAEAVLEVDRSFPWTIIRPSGVYGPGDVDFFELYKSASRGVNAYFGNREKLMSIVFVDDCIDAILASAKHPAAVHRGYFITDGVPRTWVDYQSEVVRNSGRRVLDLDLPGALVGLAARAGELATRIDGKPRLFNKQKATMDAQEAWLCSSDAATRDFGFVASVQMPDGVKKTFDWYRANRWL